MRTKLRFVVMALALLAALDLVPEGSATLPTKGYTASEEEFDRNSFGEIDAGEAEDGKISQMEFLIHLARLGKSKETGEKAFRRADQDKDGTLSLDEWKKWDGQAE